MSLTLVAMALAGLVLMLFLVAASIRPPGDGSRGVDALRMVMLATLAATAACVVGAIIASIFSIRLRRARAAGVATLLLLALVLWVCLGPWLASRIAPSSVASLVVLIFGKRLAGADNPAAAVFGVSSTFTW